MEQKPVTHQVKTVFFQYGLYAVVLVVAFLVMHRYANPAPPDHLVISTGEGEADYQNYALLYKDILHKNGVNLIVRPSSGARENLNRLKDRKSDVDVAFIQDGLDADEEATDLVSLGSLYHEPLWVFYRGGRELTRFSQFAGKKLAVGQHGGGTPVLARRLLKESGVDETNTKFLDLKYQTAAQALKKNDVDAAFFLATPDDKIIRDLIAQPSIRLMSVDQAEAITRHMPYLHHLILPHGAMDLKKNLPAEDVHLVSTTATLVARETLHPALIDLLLTAATEVHSDPGIFEKKGEFPIDKDYDFPISAEAKRFYKEGTRFWQRYLPFWLATLVDRFIFVIFPAIAFVLPTIKMIPKYFEKKIRARILQRYGELKFLETQLKNETDHAKYHVHLKELDAIEERVNHMALPDDYTEHLYVLREHIDFVRNKLSSGLEDDEKRAAR